MNIFVRIKKRLRHAGRKFYNIRTELFFNYFLIIFLCIALVGTASTYYASKSAVELSEQANLRIASQIQRNLDRDFQHKRDLLLAPYFDSTYIDGISQYVYMDLTQQYKFRQRLGDLYLMRFYVLPQPDFIRFSIYHSSGELLYYSDVYKPSNHVRNRDMLWFMRTVANNGTVYFSGTYEDPDPAIERTLFSSSILIRDFSLPNEFIVVRAEYNVQLLDELSKHANISEGSDIVIFDGLGQIVYSTYDAGTGLWYRQLMEKVLVHSAPFSMESDQGEQLQITSMQSEMSDWSIVLLTPTKDILKASVSIKRFTIVTVCIAIALTSVLSILFSKRLTTPIRQLHETANRIKMGDLSARVNVSRKNELGHIAQNFNTVADELEQLIENRYVNEIKLREAELAALHAQIHPHFLYNTLESIRAMAELNQLKEVSRMASALGELFRYSTNNDEDVVTIGDEIEHIKQYLTIQNIRFGEKVRSSIEVDEKIRDAVMLKMTLQPFVENAIQHGLERVKGGGQVRIRVKSVQTPSDMIHVEISDDGAGMTTEKLEYLRSEFMQRAVQDGGKTGRGAGRKAGIGMHNVISRYTIRYGDVFHFDLMSELGKGTRFVLAYPIEYHAMRQLAAANDKKSDY